MSLIETLILILVVAWLGGWAFIPAAGSLIHLLIVIALILLVVRLVRGNTTI